jgi:hypothetical protein
MAYGFDPLEDGRVNDLLQVGLGPMPQEDAKK